MLHIHNSNYLENLLQVLANTIKSKPLPPFIKEIIVVQNKGMERWISMQLAERLGIWANSEFPFPDTMVQEIFKVVLNLSNISSFGQETMMWTLMDILPNLLEQPNFAELNNYLQGDEANIKLFQLASRIADIFEQYMVYRPNWLTDWENGNIDPKLENDPQADWQAMLWKNLSEHLGKQHRAGLRRTFFENIANITNYPQFQRISVFGISALPHFHLEILAQLGQIIDIHIFVLNPCLEYWGDIVSDRDMFYKTVKTDKTDLPETLYFEKGNSLLASWGKMGRDFVDMLNEYPNADYDYFQQPQTANLLNCIQSNILNLQERNANKVTEIAQADKSFQVHICHSAMREVEVLHDQLLALFQNEPKLLPKDILVMTPNIEIYAPFIEAIFDTTPEANKRIPFSIADRSLRSESALIDTFFMILELRKNRFSANQVLAILETEAVQNCFDFNTQQLELIRHWIRQTNIRWGIDKADKERMGLPGYDEHTWWAGLKRLLLGYALPNDGDERLFNDILPYDDIEGNRVAILGRLITFIEKLFECVQNLEKMRNIQQWVNFLTDVLESFLEDAENKVQDIRNVLNELLKKTQEINFQTLISYEVILEYLRYPLTQKKQAVNFITGNVLFCEMLPMRSIPFKAICLLGMNDQAYPRPNKPLGFDLMHKYPKQGDRSRSYNDRYLFLESLLSARKYFYISYVGQDIHNNTVIPPSVLVSELLDYVSKSFIYPDKRPNYLTTHHPLQAFSPRYFTKNEDNLFSFSTEYYNASNILLNKQNSKKQDFIHTPLIFPELEHKIIDINQLIKFFKNPTAYFLRERLDIRLETAEHLIEESEPFEITGLELYKLNQILIEKNLKGINLKNYQQIAQAAGKLPHGKIGDYTYGNLVVKIQPFIDKVKPVISQEKLETVNVDLNIAGMRIMGSLNNIWRNNLVHYRYANLKAKDFIQIWIQHLILNSLPATHLPRHSVLIGKDKSWQFKPVENSKMILANLVKNGYWLGLTQAIHFFPESSLKFVEQLNKDKDEAEALYQANNVWQGNDFRPGEMYDDYYKLCFKVDKKDSPLQQHNFKILARQFFEELLAHRETYEF